jgi:hypothetical protein
MLPGANRNRSSGTFPLAIHGRMRLGESPER